MKKPPRKFPSPSPAPHPPVAAKPDSKPAPAKTADAKKPTHWENVADWYDKLVGDEGSEYHQKIIHPGALRLLAQASPSTDPTDAGGGDEPLKNLKGMRVLDLACGQGAFCRDLAKAGAKVVGIDASTSLIHAARAREKESHQQIAYHVADVTKLVPLAAPITAGGFDAVTIILAVQNLTPLSPVWQACSAALAPGGRLVIVMMHPCFRVFRKSGWIWDEPTETQARTVTEYLSSSKADIQMKPGEASKGNVGETTVSYHRPLQAYLNTLGNAGLWIDHIGEWASHRKPPAGIRFEALDKSRKEIPLFLALRARKT